MSSQGNENYTDSQSPRKHCIATFFENYFLGCGCSHKNDWRAYNIFIHYNLSIGSTTAPCRVVVL